MKVVVAKYSGVCFGVKRALDFLENAVSNGNNSNKKVFMLGPLIHNPRVIDDYAKRGIAVIETGTIPDNSIVVIRSHGITEEKEKKLLSQKEIEVIDTTCPFVKKIHRAVMEKALLGFAVVVLGDGDHSEVQGIISRITGDYLVVPPGDFSALSAFVQGHSKLFAVVQTTARPQNFDTLVEETKRLAGDKTFEYLNTVCDATYQRQNAAKTLAGEVDSMIVIGGRNSSNTTKLFNIIKEANHNSIWIESLEDISKEELNMLKNCDVVGITAGASTPDCQINELKSFLEAM